jgi:hypothetical protein
VDTSTTAKADSVPIAVAGQRKTRSDPSLNYPAIRVKHPSLKHLRYIIVCWQSSNFLHLAFLRVSYLGIFLPLSKKLGTQIEYPDGSIRWTRSETLVTNLLASNAKRVSAYKIVVIGVGGCELRPRPSAGFAMQQLVELCDRRQVG